MHTVTHYMMKFFGNLFLTGYINSMLLFHVYYQKHVLQVAYGIQQKSSGAPKSNEGLHIHHQQYLAPKINSNLCNKFNIIYLPCNIHMLVNLFATCCTSSNTEIAPTSFGHRHGHLKCVHRFKIQQCHW